MTYPIAKIALAHVYADDNKGDLGIIQSTVLGIRDILSSNGIAPEIQAISMFRESDVLAPKTHRLLRNIVDSIQSAPINQKYEESRGTLRSLTKLFQLAFQACRTLLSVKQLQAGRRVLVDKNVLSIFNSDVLICKGGSLLHCDGSIRAHLFLFRMLAPLWVSSSLQIPTFIFGQSIGPFSTRASKGLMRHVGNSCTKIYVRDQTSLNYLKDIGILDSKIGLIPDPAFLLRSYIPENKYPISKPSKVIGITCLNVTREITAQHGYEEMIVKVLSSFLSTNNGWSVIFFPQVIGPDPWQDDRAVSRRIADKLGCMTVSDIEVDERDLTPIELCNLYSTVDILFGSRLHSTIFASVVNTPAVVIEYQQAKAKGALEWLHRPKWVFHYSAPWEDVLAALDGLATNLHEEKDLIHERGISLSQMVRDGLVELLEQVPVPKSGKQE